MSLPRPEDEGLVFRKADSTAWGRIETAFKTALERADISNFRFHDLRHTCASWLVMDGATPVEVKELLGHRSLAMTMRYAHLAPGRLRDAVIRLDKVFGVEEGRNARSSVRIPAIVIAQSGRS